jgi:hypothetical protein
LSLLDSLDEEYAVQLRGRDHRVPLEVVEKKQGNGIEQVLLRPKEALKAGERYRLRIPDIGKEREKQLLISYDDEEGKREWIAWYVRSEKDQRAPEWEEWPEHTGNSYEELGCGPSIKAIFQMDAEDASEIWVRVELKALKTGRTDRYILSLGDDGRLEVGHGMCSGAFSFLEDSEYEARFKLLDASANANEQWSEWIPFDNPREESG